MTSLVDQWVKLGLDRAAAVELSAAVENPSRSRLECWRLAMSILHPTHPQTLHTNVHQTVFRDEPQPAPAWIPTEDEWEHSNVGRLQRQLDFTDYPSLHRWSAQNRGEFWEAAIRCLDLSFHRPPRTVLEPGEPGAEVWLPDAEVNVADWCLRGASEDLAVIEGRARSDGGGLSYRRWTVGQLRRMVGRIAQGLRAMEVSPGDRIALDTPMRAEAVAAYLAALAVGCSVVTIADSFAVEEIRVRLEIAQPTLIFTQDFIARGDKRLPLYERVIAAGAPRAVLLAVDPNQSATLQRSSDVTWSDFLSDEGAWDSVPRSASELHTILFSSGTTGNPKAIPWDASTTIKAATDAYFHHDTRPGDILCWPSNMGWMMGPWLVFGSLINGAALAIFDGLPTGRDFAHFVQQAKVTILGLVPSLVTAWRQGCALEGIDWTGLRVLSSTGECSNSDDMFWLMGQAGYKPMIEYCGGTEIGGGYMTGAVAQPCIPGHFTTPALGLDLVILDDDHQPASEGEVFLLPPSMGLSRTLLNGDHHAVYYANTPQGRDGHALRRHGDRMREVREGVYRAQGRADDSMNLGGIKVSSLQIEEVALRATASRVSEVAAIAVPPTDGGPDRLVLYVVRRADAKEPDDASECDDPEDSTLREAIQSAIRQRVNPLFKVHAVVHVDSLPRTASNKVMRRRLRDAYQQSERPE